jgi:hypothetical protein
MRWWPLRSKARVLAADVSQLEAHTQKTAEQIRQSTERVQELAHVVDQIGSGLMDELQRTREELDAAIDENDRLKAQLAEPCQTCGSVRPNPA